uniref:ShKT domain-containing protein n=1 Tax=Ditylenchus dipsaci TaxID=166011 RepID=A0A915E0W7_9BILA
MQNLPGTPTNVPRGFMNNPAMAFNPSSMSGQTARCRNFMHPTHGDNDCSHDAAHRCSDPTWQPIMFSNCAGTCIRMGVKVPGC